MDSNNFINSVGVGEREARVACELVARRHYRLAHGIGRSGDISAEQPKAAGSSLLTKLTNLLALDALRVAGLQDTAAVSVVPVATGMALTLTLMALPAKRRQNARYVLWPRIDQKTCLKSILAAGFEVVVIENKLEGDQLQTDMEELRRQIEVVGSDAIAAVLSTTSCFAPRAADSVVEVARLCDAAGIPHIINNAYGVQSSTLCAAITSAMRKGRVDAVVQSTDKNFMVPVGGAVVAAGKKDVSLVKAVNALYPGRAAMSPLLDVLITLLHWGKQGWQQVLAQREQLYCYAKQKLAEAAEKLGERVLECPGNPISLGITLHTLIRQQKHESHDAAVGDGSSPSHAPAPDSSNAAAENLTYFGSMLFNRYVSGTRVVAPGKTQDIGGVRFEGYGAHTDKYPHPYLTVAAALGTSEEDIDEFVIRLMACFNDFRKQKRGTSSGAV